MIEDALVLDNFDIYASAGFNTAMSVTFPGIAVSDGQLTLDFVSVKDSAMISAIEIDDPTMAQQPVAVGAPLTPVNNFVTLDRRSCSPTTVGHLQHGSTNKIAANGRPNRAHPSRHVSQTTREKSVADDRVEPNG